MDSYCGVTCHDHEATEQRVGVGDGFLPDDHCLFPKALRSRVRRRPFTEPWRLGITITRFNSFVRCARFIQFIKFFKFQRAKLLSRRFDLVCVLRRR